MTANQPTSPALQDRRSTAEKEQNLRTLMRSMGSVLVAYSGGVDSSYLGLIASQELGPKALCVMGLSPSVAEHERRAAARIAELHGFGFETVGTNEISAAGYVANQPNRCYFCKTELYQKLSEVAGGRGFAFVADGTNIDDLGDHRPGRIAALEKNVRSPLVEAGFTKTEIRVRSRELGLGTWDKPASPCLSSRIAYGTPVTIERLGKVERGETVLREMGFREFRVRVHGDLARIEIARDEFGRIQAGDIMETVGSRLKKIGFRYVTLDLNGFRSGSLNERADT